MHSDYFIDMSVVVKVMDLIILPLSFFKETLRAAEVQPACAVQTLPVSTCGTPFFSCWKDPKTHRESRALTVFATTVNGYLLCRNVGNPLCLCL